MERREFIKIVCGLVGTWPIAAYAQQVGELRRIGVLGADATVWSSWTVAFITRLRELDWITGEAIDVDYRWAGGNSKRVSDFTAEFLRRNVDVIVTYGSAATVVQQVTTTISCSLGYGVRFLEGDWLVLILTQPHRPMSAFGTKRTLLSDALTTSACQFDPIRCLVPSLGGAARLHHRHCWLVGRMATRGAGRGRRPEVHPSQFSPPSQKKRIRR